MRMDLTRVDTDRYYLRCRGIGAAAPPTRMNLRRLSWAGIEATSGGSRILVDALENPAPLAGFLGAPRAQIVTSPVDERTWAAITHLHPDHCDRRLLRRLPPRHALCHAPLAEPLEAEGVSTTPASLWQTLDAGPFRLTPVPSHDWRGDDQVAWIIEADDRRVIHCGDTIWHGHWYEIARRFAPIDIALLPINGVVVQLDGFTPTEVPATLTPEQAVEAAIVLQARVACAIHHGLFHNPPLYTEQDDAVERFAAAARRRGIHAVAPVDGAPVPTA
jgi:L-ascorbate metabolism protein UlaG (beta-lactamase superfamily)